MEVKKKAPKKKWMVLIAIILVVAIIAGSLFLYLSRKTHYRNDANVPPKTDMSGLEYYETSPKNFAKDANTGIEYVNNEILMYATENATKENIQDLAMRNNCRVVGSIPLINRYQLQLQEEKDYSSLQTIITTLERDSFVESASLNYVIAYDAQYIPNDTVERWNFATNAFYKFNNWGTKAIDAQKAWDYRAQITEPVNIGIYDNMFDSTHPDLSFAEEPLLNVTANTSNKFDSHGTHVAGIMAATFDNGLGIAGVSPKNNLYGAAFRGGESLSSSTDKRPEYYEELSYFYLIGMKHCRVVNVSAGLNTLTFNADREEKEHLKEKPAQRVLKSRNELLTQLFKKLLEKQEDFVIVKASGNQNSTGYKYFKKDSNDTDYPFEYISLDDYEKYCKDPKTSAYSYARYTKEKVEIREKYSGDVDARFDMISGITDEDVKSHVIVVGAIQKEGREYSIADFSQCGSSVDILAPGVGITSTGWTPVEDSTDTAIVEKMSGTSQAAPFVSGVAGMLYSINPELKGDQVKSIIKETGTGTYGKENYKLLNAKNAVETIVNEKEEFTQTTSEAVTKPDYSDVMEQYQNASRSGFLRHYEYVNENIIGDPMETTFSLSADDPDLYYAMEDMNQDGVDELLIGYDAQFENEMDGSRVIHCIDVYTFDGKPIRYVPETVWFDIDGDVGIAENNEIIHYASMQYYPENNGRLGGNIDVYSGSKNKKVASEKHIVADYDDGFFCYEIGANGSKKTISWKDYEAYSDYYLPLLNEQYGQDYDMKYSQSNPSLHAKKINWKLLEERQTIATTSKDNIDEDQAFEIAKEYWNWEEGQVEEGIRTGLFSDGPEYFDGVKWYKFRLSGYVDDHYSTWDIIYVNASTGSVHNAANGTP